MKIEEFSQIVNDTFESKSELLGKGITKWVENKACAQVSVVGPADLKSGIPDSIDKVIYLDEPKGGSMVASLDEDDDELRLKATELGRLLARQYDNVFARSVALAAYKPDAEHGLGSVHGIAGGNRPENIPGKTGEGTIEIVLNDAISDLRFTNQFLDNVRLISEQFDRNNVPENGRYLLIHPSVANRLVGHIFTSGLTKSIRGFEVIVSNACGFVGSAIRDTGINYTVPTADYPTGLNHVCPDKVNGSVTNAYGADLTKVLAAAFHTSSVGIVRKGKVMCDSTWITTAQTNVIRAYVYFGMSGIRPESAALIVWN